MNNNASSMHFTLQMRLRCIMLTIMRSFLLFIIIGITTLKASESYSQTKLSIFVEEISLEDFFNEIQDKSEYIFFYKDDILPKGSIVSVRNNNVTLENLLNPLLTNYGLGFKIDDRQVIIFEEEKVTSNKPQTFVLQQGIQVQGTILDEEGIPLVGANIIEKGTTNGTQTDFDGNFSINVEDVTAVLVVSYIGFSTREIQVGNQVEYNIMLSANASGLDEVVVIGFGERKKKDLTGSIATVNAESIEKVQAVSPQFALQGNTSGVRVVNTSGDPNEGPQIFVRGIGTWNGSSQPLYVIDGQIIEPPRAGNQDEISGQGLSTPPNLFNLINPNDIESISVLKDASAAAIYGNRGANGVILITTKKGKMGKPVIEFNTVTTISNTPAFDMLDTDQYRTLVNEMYANNLNPDITIENQLYGRDADSDATRLESFSPQFDPQSPFYIGSSRTYDWQDELINQQAFSHSYDLKVSGATDKVNYYVSGSYLNQDQVLEGNNLKRYTAAMNINTDITDWLNVGLNYKYTYQLSKLNNTGDLIEFAQVAPWQPLRDAGNGLGFAPVLDPFAYSADWRQAKLYGQGTRTNRLALNSINYRDFTISRNIGQAYVELRPFPSLTLRGSLNFDLSAQTRFTRDVFTEGNIFARDGIDPSTEAPDAPNSLGVLRVRNNDIYNYQSDFTATYSNLFGNHSINLTAAIQDQRHRRTFEDFGGSNLLLLTDDPKKQSFSNDVTNNTSIRGVGERFWFGLVGRLSYNYDSKYYVDFSYRRDASSGFDDDYRWGNFYSASGAWRVTGEKFMENVNFINDLKLRGSYGEAGNDEAAVGQFAFLSGVSTSLSSTRFGAGNGDPLGFLYLGSLVNDLANPGLSWETVTTTSAALDAIMFDNKLNLTVEWFKRETDGVLQTVGLPPSTQLSAPLLNIGKLENKGIDVQLGYNDRFGDFNLGLSGNISFLKNEVIELFDNQPLFTGIGRIEEGRSIGHIWGYKVGGIFQTQEEIDAYFSQNPDNTISNSDFVAPGDMYFQDIGGAPTEEERFYSTTPDGVIDSFDQTEIGNTIPGYTYGFNLNLSWKGFDLFAGFYGEGDVDRYNDARSTFESMAGPTNFWTKTLNRWTPSNTNTSIPRAVIGDPAGNNRFSSRYVESAAFFRLNNWQLGYSLSQRTLDSIGGTLKKIRIYVGGQNNIYVSNWSGLDPVNDTFPLPRTLIFGMNVSF